MTDRADPEGPHRRAWEIALAAGLAGLGATGLALWGTSRHGVGLSPDAIQYIAAARHLLAGEGLTNVQGAPIVKWPPLFPALLAAGGFWGIEPAAGARYLNAACLGLTVATAGAWLMSRLKSRALALLALPAVLFSQPLLAVATFAWSGAPFILLVVLALPAGTRYLERGGTAMAAGFGLLTALALLTRLPGAALVATGAALVVLRPTPWATRAREGAVFVGVACAPLALWLLRNRLVAGTAFGDRAASEVDVAEHLADAGRQLLGWVVPPAPLGDPVQALATAGAAVAAALVAWAFRRHCRDRSRRVPAAVLPWALFAGLYLGLVIAARSVVGQSGLEPRYLVPAFVPLGLCAAWVADRALRAWRRRGPRPRLFAATLVGAVALWLGGYPVPYAGSFVLQQARNGAGGYATDAWQAVLVFRFLAEHPLPGTVLTNRPALVYWFSGRPARTSPTDAALADPVARLTLARRLAANLAEGPVFLVWVHAATPEGLAGPEVLGAALDLAPVAEFRDGSATVQRLRSGIVRPPGP